MFKRKERAKELFKKYLSLILAIVLAFSSLASTGMALSKAYAAPTTENNYGVNFVNKLVEITKNRTPYVWGGWQYNYPNGSSGVDCRGFVRVALRDTYGLNIFETYGYLVNEQGEPINKKGQVVDYKNRVLIDMAAYNAAGTWDDYVGQRVCVEGKGIHTYYRVLAAGKCGSLKTYNNQYKNNVLDIKFNKNTYSSLIAYACKFPGSIIAHNGHYGVGVGEYHSMEALLADYPELDQKASGSACTEADRMIRWSESAYQYGNQFPEDDLKYWFGKTVFISACSTKSGIRLDNFTTTGKSANPTSSDDLTILLCESQVPTSEITFTKYDTKTCDVLAGAVYKVYKDSACTIEVAEFTTTATSVTLTLDYGKYYVKEISAPKGYELSTEVVAVDAKSAKVSVNLYEKSTDATVFVRKVDAIDGISLAGAVIDIYEWNKTKDAYETAPFATLEYNSLTGAYTINGAYTNNEGNEHKDNALHYTQTNLGKFLLKETKAPAGYINGGFTHEYDMVRDGSLMLTNNTAIKNTAKLIVQITKTDLNGNPLKGAHLKLVYNGVNYEGYTDDFGKLTFTDIPEGPTRQATLIELEPPAGYKALGAYATANGQSIVLNKGITAQTIEIGGQEYSGFISDITVVNAPKSVEMQKIETGTIHIKKMDLSYIQEIVPGSGMYMPGRALDGATYGLFSDPDCVNPVLDKDGNAIKATTANGGKITFENIPLGTYYVKELWAPEGYSVISTVYPANLLMDYAQDGKVEITIQAVDFRQTVTLSMVKKDVNTEKGVEGSVYALKNKTKIIDPVFGTEIEPHTTLGYYVTNKEGQIIATRIGSAQIDIREEMYPAVNLFGEWEDYVALPNGVYYFEEQSAPNGYVVDTTPVEVDASWQSYSFSQDMILPNGTVSAYGMTYAAKAPSHKENRQNVVIEFSKIDGLLNNNNTAAWYSDLENYAAAANNGMAATLQGAKYQLINVTEIIDIDTGINIPANTVLGIYETDASGCFVADQFTQGTFKNHKIPNGLYHLVEMQAPQGYALNADPVVVDAQWSPLHSDELTLRVTKTAKDFVLTQNVQINKVTNDNKPIKGVQFELYSVADILETCQFSTIDELPWKNSAVNANGFAPIDRDGFVELINQYNLQPAKDMAGADIFETNENGIAMTDQFVYGDYILHEVAAPSGYKVATTSSYIQLPWELYDNEGSTDDDNVDEDLDGTHVSQNKYYLHDVESNPVAPLDVTVVNLLNTTVLISKYETIDGVKIPVIGAELQLIDVNTNEVVILEDGTICRWTTTDGNPSGLHNLPAYEIRGIHPGTYQLQEIVTPTGYVSTVFEPFTVRLTSDIQKFAFENQYTSIAIEKLDAESQTGLIGAEMAVVDQYDNIVTDIHGTELKWTTDGSVKVFTHIPVGSYFVKELKAPYGYQINNEKVAINVTNTATTVHASMQDDRTYGKIIINKTDEMTDAPLAGVVFEIRSANTVIDPITQQTLFTKDQVLDTITTDANGHASSIVLPIATYDLSGLDEFITYSVVETKPVPGNQYAPAITRTITLPYLGETTPIVESEIVAIANSKPVITINKTADIQTFTGDVAQYKDVTVLNNGDIINYTINVHNAGTASAWHIAVKDPIPANTTLLSYDEEVASCVYNEQTNELSWIIKEVQAGQTVQLTFAVKVNSAQACSIVNTAFYSIPDEVPANVDQLPNLDDYVAWEETNDIVYQVVEFNKTSTVPGGHNDATAVVVVPGEKVTYHLTFKAVHDVNDVVFIDEIPAGMTYVDGSAKVNGEPTNAVSYNDRIITFDPMHVDNETITVSFDVIVDYVAPGNTIHFVNIAEVEFMSRPDAPTPSVLVSDVVTHVADNNVTVTKTADPESHSASSQDAWQADPSAKLTVIKQGDTITYTLTATNNGNSEVKNIVITDSVPEGLEYVSHAQNDGIESWYNAETGLITWRINKLAGKTNATMSFVATVKEQKSHVVSNTAYYGIVNTTDDDVPVLGEVKESTNTITHQIVEFHKTSVVVGSAQKDQAVAVTAGDKIDYVLSVTNPHTVYNVSVFDKMPEGLKYVPGSIYIKYNDEEWVQIDDSDILNANQGKDATAIHLAFDKLNAGTHYIKFSVSVQAISIETSEKFFMNQATLTYNQFADNDESTQQLLSEEVHHMTDVKITGNKIGNLDTFVGKYENRHDVQVVHDGQNITYTISVANNGASDLHNVLIKDVIPTHTIFVSADNNGTYDSANQDVHWTIAELKAGTTASVTVTVKCNTNGKAYDLINRAYYTVEGNEWIATDEVVYQTVSFKKTSIVLGGTTEENATTVSVGDTITYVMIFDAPSDVYGLTVSDKIPSGLTYVPESATIDGQPAFVTINDQNVIVFESKDIKNTQCVFQFDVIVDEIALDTPTTYINQATAIYSDRGVNGNIETLVSEKVTHKAYIDCEVTKTATPNTYIGNKDNAQFVTVLKKDDVVTYTISVKNTGISTLTNLAIKDVIPNELQYIPNDQWNGARVWYDETTKEITWLIEAIDAGETIDLTFDCVVEKQQASLIVNNATYGLAVINGDDAPTFKETAKTNDVVHQVVEFHKTSNVLGGSNKEEATTVNRGDIIEYVLLFETKHDVSSLEIFDQLPEGLAYVPGSIAIKFNDSEWETIDDSDILAANEGKTASAINIAFDNTVNGKLYIKFAASVKSIPVNTEKFFMNQASATYDVFTNSDDSITHTLLSEEIHHMTDVKIYGNKNAKIETFVGNYDAKHNVTIVKDGDELEYTITINNNGVSILNNVMVIDQIPQYTTFISADFNGEYDADENCVVWTIDEIKPGESAELTLIVKCDTAGEAREIVNKASYAVIEDSDTESQWFDTDSVVYQTVALTKSASIKYGIDETDAEHVDIGTEFTYEIKFTSTNDVYNLVLSDKLPNGLTLLPETLKCLLPNGEYAPIEEFIITQDNIIILPAIEVVGAGETVLTFNVKVADVDEYDKDYIFINQAFASVASMQDGEDIVELASNTVSNKTLKTNKTETPALGLEINETLMWSIIAVISMIGMFGFGIYAFKGNKSKRK